MRELLDATPEPLPPEDIARAFRGRLTPQRRGRVEEVPAIMVGPGLGIARAGEREGATLFQARR